MLKRNGFHSCAFALLLVWLVPVSAEESADDIIAMMGWWEEYGRYWDEIGTDAGSDADVSFAYLDAQAVSLQEAVQ